MKNPKPTPLLAALRWPGEPRYADCETRLVADVERELKHVRQKLREVSAALYPITFELSALKKHQRRRLSPRSKK